MKYAARMLVGIAALGISITSLPAAPAAAAPAAAPAPVTAHVSVTTAPSQLPTLAGGSHAAPTRKSRVPARCRTKGRVLCVDKSTRKLRYVVNGRVIMTMDARFGSASHPTRNGTFRVFKKSYNHRSSIYHTWMPRAMFFSGGQAVHYSPDFAARGYYGASHGCVNIRNWSKINYVYKHIRVGDKVVVYWS